MPFGVAIAGAATLGAGYMAANASQNAAQTQANSAQNATNAELNMYNQNVSRLSPWTNAGASAENSLSSLMPQLTSQFTAADYQNSPGYAYQLQQGSQAIADQASALGGVNSGKTLTALQTQGTNLANQNFSQAQQAYQNWQNQVYGMYSGIANTGANAAGQMAGIGAQTGQSIGGNIIGAGNAQAAGQVGAANAYGNSLSNLGNLGLYAQMQGNPGGGFGSQDPNMLYTQNPGGGNFQQDIASVGGGSYGVLGAGP